VVVRITDLQESRRVLIADLEERHLAEIG